METQTSHSYQRAPYEGADRSTGELSSQRGRLKPPNNKLGVITSFEEPLIFEKSLAGRTGYSLPSLDVPEVSASKLWAASWTRTEVAGFPEVSENEVVRHFVRLSQKNYAIDLGFYPLGSCTMKYNPKINEEIANRERFANLHPFWPAQFQQHALSLQYDVQNLLKLLTGLPGFTLQPSAGAHGEYTGIKVMRAYHQKKGNKKNKVLIPESAHGTNPATCAMLGYEIVSIPSNDTGIVHLEEVEKLLDDEVAGIMITNPNTLGLFEENIHLIAKKIHEKDGLVYMDGANFNAILGITRPADLGVDIMHINLHKTFSTPHGGGGPGAGAVGVRENLIQFLPMPAVKKTEKGFSWNYDMPDSIGRIGGYFGNFSIHVRALAYLLSIGSAPDGKSIPFFRKMSEAAVLNANYIRARLKGHYHIPHDRACMHECLISDQNQNADGIKTLDIAKRLMDYGYHPMTVYFPLVVSGAMLIEPTESETKENLDDFCDAMIAIAEECKSQPEIVRTAPHCSFRKRVDELRAQKQPRLRWTED